MKTGTELRRDALREVENCVCRDRQNTHGPAESNFAAIAEFWTTYLRTRGLVAPAARIEAFDVAAMSGLIKSARAAHNPHHRDNWIDAAGYAICGAGIIARVTEQAVAAASAIIGDAPCGMTSAEKIAVVAAQSPLAFGHNPDRLTEEQVKVREGWRLLEPKEIRDRDETQDIEVWHPRGQWVAGYGGCSSANTYRTRKPPGYFLAESICRSYSEALNAEVAK